MRGRICTCEVWACFTMSGWAGRFSCVACRRLWRYHKGQWVSTNKLPYKVSP